MIHNLLRPGGLANRFSVTVALLVVALIGITMYVARDRVASSMDQALQTRGESIAAGVSTLAAPALRGSDAAALQDAASRAAHSEGVIYVVIYDRQGSAVGRAGRLPASEEPDPSLDQSRARNLVVRADGVDEPAIEIVAPVLLQGSSEPAGRVRVALSRRTTEAELARLDLAMIVLGIVLTFAAVFAVRYVARRITQPLRLLVAGTEAVASGDMNHRIEVSGPREITDLARSFNVMVDRVQDKARESLEFRQALESLNATLEDQVLQRTLALQESESKYKTLVEHSPFGILIVQQGQVRFYNKAFAELFGLDGKPLGADFRVAALFDEASVETVARRLQAWERGDAAPPAVVAAEGPGGNKLDLELRGSRIEYLGKPAAECLMVDMTETRQLRDHIDQTERLRALGELAGGVAHDFNNLLGAILGRTQLLRRMTPPGDMDTSLAVIEKSAQDGRETVRRIQEFSRVRRDREETPVDLSEIVRDAVEITRTRWKDDAESRNVSIRVELETEEVAPVLGSPSEFREVYTNLILNAVDAMPNGGEMAVRCWEQDGTVRTQVRDNGVGMTDEIRRHLFDPFFSTKGQAGTGLGLSVVYGIVQRLGGEIAVESEPGHGTVFTLAFPVADTELVEVAEDEEQPVGPGRPGRVLVIDDEPMIAELLRDTLLGDGHKVDIALNGTDGVGLAAVTDYDLVFTDLGMPDLSGWDVAARILAEKPGQRVVLVTGWGATLEDEQVRQRGIAGVVHKPFEIEELRRVTARQLHLAMGE